MSPRDAGIAQFRSRPQSRIHAYLISDQRPGPMSSHRIINMIKSHTVSFFSHVSLALPGEGGESVGPLLAGQRLRVQAQMPNRLRIESWTKRSDVREATVIQLLKYDLFISDGVRQYEGNRLLGIATAAPAARKLESIRSESKITWLVGVDLIFGQLSKSPTLRREEGTDTSGPVTIYTQPEAEGGKTVLRRLYVSKATGLPTRLSVFVVGPENSELETQRVDYRDWELNVVLDPTTFDLESVLADATIWRKAMD